MKFAFPFFSGSSDKSAEKPQASVPVRARSVDGKPGFSVQK